MTQDDHVKKKLFANIINVVFLALDLSQYSLDDGAGVNTIMCDKSCYLDATIVYDNSTIIVTTSLHIHGNLEE
jgi:hypothetical protein